MRSSPVSNRSSAAWNFCDCDESAGMIRSRTGNRHCTGVSANSQADPGRLGADRVWRDGFTARRAYPESRNPWIQGLADGFDGSLG